MCKKSKINLCAAPVSYFLPKSQGSQSQGSQSSGWANKNDKWANSVLYLRSLVRKKSYFFTCDLSDIFSQSNLMAE